MWRRAVAAALRCRQMKITNRGDQVVAGEEDFSGDNGL
jgi:hypothetical protein